jgi:hypothetical protein
LGDLRENAEYKAGKEKQEQLNAAVGRMKDEIEKCQVFDPSKVNTDKDFFWNESCTGIITKQEKRKYLQFWGHGNQCRKKISYLTLLLSVMRL